MSAQRRVHLLQLAERYDFVVLAYLNAQCRQQGLDLGDGSRYQTASEPRTSHLRLGFAALNPEELTQSIRLLAQVLRTR